MKIGLYISELLQDHDCVVFPGLGAFTAHAVDAQFDKSYAKLLPPSYQIRFNPEIKVNDGILLNHFAQKQEITAPKAFIEIENLCNEINYRLDHGETVGLEGLGTIKRKEGKNFFEAYPDVEKMPDAFGLEPIELKVYDTVIKRTLPESVDSKSEKTSTQTLKKRKLNWLYLMPVLAAIFFIFWFLWPEGKKEYNENVSLEINPSEAFVPAAKDSIPEANIDETQLDEEIITVQEHPQEGLFYLVGGSFKTRENAEQYFEQISKKGYEPLQLGVMGSFHVVAIAVYPSEREAVIAQNRVLRQDSTAGVWVYYIPVSK
jgi:hypothetical protein